MQYRAEIDGLRAVAVIPVILFHAGFTFFSGGFVGVDIFFVISGYLITSIIIDENKNGRFSIIQFYERRARRLLPALFFVLLVTTVLGWFWLLPNEYRQYSQSLLGVASFTSNIFFYLTGGYFGGGNDLKPLIHTWSLSVEEQFYVLFPLLFLLVARTRTKLQYFILLALVIASLSFAQWQSSRDTAFNYLLLPSRFWELAAGSIIALYLSSSPPVPSNTYFKNLLAIIGSFFIIASVIFFSKDTPYPSLYTVLPVLGVSLIILYADQSTWIGRLLSFKAVVSIGLISYSAYLWHQVLFSLARHRAAMEPGPAAFGLLTAITLIVAYLTWRFVEQPFRNRQKFSRKTIFVFSLSGIVIFSAFGLAGHFTNGFESRLPDNVAAAHITQLHEKQLRTAGCRMSGQSIDISHCQRGAATPLSVALVGDSHAAALVSQLDLAGSKYNFSFVPLVHSACPLNFSLQKNEGNVDEQYCADFQNAIKNLLSDEKIETVIVATRFDAPTKSIELSKSQTIKLHQHISALRQILTAGKKVILVYPVPVYSVYISDYIAKNLWFYNGQLNDITMLQNDFHQRVKFVTDLYDSIQSPNLVRIKSEEIFCGTIKPGTCITEYEGKPLYYDDDHLSSYGAQYIINGIIPHMTNNSRTIK